MPELPEVEFARGVLDRWLCGKTIAHARFAASRVLAGVSPAGAARALSGRRVRGVERRGKWLRLALDDGSRLFSHLGMSGRWVRVAPRDGSIRHERARLEVSRASICYVDPRMFGRLLVARASAEDPPGWSALGPDALTDFDTRALHAALAARRRAVKEVLMDQTVVAGIGNIQATEALWRAAIDPRSRSDALERADVNAIARGVRGSLRATLKMQQADAESIAYVEDAGAPNPFRVYGRHGQPCPRCGVVLQRIVLAGRGTTFCPGCQRRV